MTYKEILSQVISRLGYKGHASLPKADIRYALQWAESELIGEQKVIQKSAEIQLSPTESEYRFPSDYNEPSSFAITDSNGNLLDHIEVTLDQWLKWNPELLSRNNNEFLEERNETKDIQIRSSLRNRIVISTKFDGTYHILLVKPTILGKVTVVYNQYPEIDPFTNLDSEPRLPLNFHHYLIDGIVYYMAQIEAAKAVQNGDFNTANFFNRLVDSANANFMLRKGKVRENVGGRAEPAVIKPFTWFDSSRKYR